MSEETMSEIQKVSKERLNLYLQASHDGLTPKESQRLHELNDLIPLLWDRYRREFVRQSDGKGRAEPLYEAA